MGVYRPMTVSLTGTQRENMSSRAASHRLDEPTGLSLSMVASLHCPLPFHLTKLL